MADKNLNINIVAKDKSKQALNKVQGNLDKTKSSVLNLKNALIGLGAGLAVKSIINVANEVEGLQVRFKFLFGSVKEGEKAFDSLAGYASKVPFSLRDIAAASGNLAVVAKDAEELNKILKITGNVAAFTGLDFQTTASQIQRAFAGGISAADIFREKGLRSILGFEAGAKVSIADTIKAFEEKFGKGGEFGEITDELAKTFAGTMSMLADKLFTFQRAIADGGFFPELKKQFGDLNKVLEENAEEMAVIAKFIGSTLGDAIRGAANTIKFLADNTFILKTAAAAFIGLKLAKVFLFIGIQAKKLLLTQISLTALMGPVGWAKIATAVGIAGAAYVALEVSLRKVGNEADDSREAIKRLGEETLKWQETGDDKTLKDAIKTNKKVEAFKKTVFSKEIKSIQDSFLNERQLVLKKNEEDIALINKFLEEELNITRAQKNHLEDLKKEIYERGVNDIALIAEKEVEALQAVEDEKTRILNEANEKRIEDIRKEGSVLENLKENYAAFFKDFNEGKLVAEALTATFADLTKGIGDAIAQSIVFGKSFKETFGDVARQALASLISALVQIGVQLLVNKVIQEFGIKTSEESTKTALKAIKKEAEPTAFLVSLATAGSNAIGAIAGTIATWGITKALSGRRTGGQVTGGTPYMVGEQGQEMFVPNQSGTIVPNDRLGGGQNINITINANDTQGFDELLIKRRATIVNVINDALNSQGKEALV